MRIVVVSFPNVYEVYLHDAEEVQIETIPVYSYEYLVTTGQEYAQALKTTKAQVVAVLPTG